MDRHRHLMTRAAIVWVLCGWLAAGLLITACGDGDETPKESPSVTETPVEEQEIVVISMSSDTFGTDEAIPPRFTCDGKNVSPALSWSGVPQDTQSYALIVDDPDAPGGDFAHWVLYNLPIEGQDLPEAVAKTERPEIGGLQGKNDFGDIGYGGPCPPPDDPHRYRFSLYALDELLELGPGASKQDVLDEIQDHVLGEAQLVGSYER